MCDGSEKLNNTRVLGRNCDEKWAKKGDELQQKWGVKAIIIVKTGEKSQENDIMSKKNSFFSWKKWLEGTI